MADDIFSLIDNLVLSSNVTVANEYQVLSPRGHARAQAAQTQLTTAAKPKESIDLFADIPAPVEWPKPVLPPSEPRQPALAVAETPKEETRVELPPLTGLPAKEEPAAIERPVAITPPLALTTSDGKKESEKSEKRKSEKKDELVASEGKKHESDKGERRKSEKRDELVASDGERRKSEKRDESVTTPKSKEGKDAAALLSAEAKEPDGASKDRKEEKRKSDRKDDASKAVKDASSGATATASKSRTVRLEGGEKKY